MKRMHKYYDFEYDEIITESTARRRCDAMNKWREQRGLETQTFEQYVEENLYDLRNRIENAAAQAAHDRCGIWEPVCSWRTLHKRAH